DAWREEWPLEGRRATVEQQLGHIELFAWLASLPLPLPDAFPRELWRLQWTCPLGWSSELTQESATLVDMSPDRRNCRLTEVFEEEGFK
ncbi:unnamed protein product, partial [Effrenium voratum]